MTDYIWPITLLIICLISSGCFAGWRVLLALNRSFELSLASVADSMDHVRTSHVTMSRKMEVWHENSIQVANSHAERMSELLSVDVEGRYAQTQIHARERAELALTAAQKSTNEKLAEINEEKLHTDHEGGGNPPKKRIEPSKASVSRQKVDAGGIAQRHATRS